MLGNGDWSVGSFRSWTMAPSASTMQRLVVFRYPDPRNASCDFSSLIPLERAVERNQQRRNASRHTVILVAVRGNYDYLSRLADYDILQSFGVAGQMTGLRARIRHL